MAKEYVRPIPNTWWLKKRAYTIYMVREFTSIFVAAYVVFLLILVARAQDEAGFGTFFEALKEPLSIIFHMIVLLMVTLHTITWFVATPKVVVVYRGSERVPPQVIAGAHYAAWIVVSLVIAWLVLR